ncbi:hypothetical protein ACJ41O_007025 [Fusarium nematophilum]
MSPDTDPSSTPRLKPGQFPPPIILVPLSPPHNLTVIILHGRGFNAQKFHPSLLSSPCPPSPSTFHGALSHARIVLPTAPLSRAAKYRRSLIHQWYEGTGDWEPSSRGDMRPSVERLHGILRDEVERLGGDAGRVVLMGFSQGAAMALVSWLLWEGRALGGVVVMSGFVPLAESMMGLLEEEDDEEDLFEGEEDEEDVFERDGEEREERTPLQRAIDELREEAEVEAGQPDAELSFLPTPVFMGHGLKDEDVEYRHGVRASELLERMGVEVEFNTYPDLAHWYSPEMLGDIVKFLDRLVGL